MYLNRTLFRAFAFAAALSAPLGSFAAITVVNSAGAFNVLVGTRGVDGFDDLVTEGLSSVSANRTAAPFAYTAAAANGLYFFPGLLSTAASADSLVLSNFSAGVYGFAANFSAQNFFGAPSAGQLSFKYNGSAIGAPVNVPTGTGFVGFVFDAPIVGEITVTSNVLDFGDVYLAVDNLTIASAVPELGTFPLIVAGAGALFAATLRRRRVG